VPPSSGPRSSLFALAYSVPTLCVYHFQSILMYLLNAQISVMIPVLKLYSVSYVTCCVSKRWVRIIFLQVEDNLKSSDTPELINLPQLLAFIIQHLPENGYDYILAVSMVDTVQALISTSKDRSGT
jgi:hypothetical protein